MVDTVTNIDILGNLRAESCQNLSITHKEGVVLYSKPGQDLFNIPKLHVADSLARCVMPVTGDFTLKATCQVYPNTKFDGAGLYFENGSVRLKFGVEDYGEGPPRIVSVKIKGFSDEANGSVLESCKSSLVLSRNDSIISCYSEQIDGVRFERAFFEKELNETSILGFYVQSPFSDLDLKGAFTEISLIDSPSEHLRA